MTTPRLVPVRLQLLGSVTVLPGRLSVGVPLLTRPRPLAVLIYLTLARPRGLQSRDTLLALLWSESSEERSRHALRNALHAIRAHLGNEVIMTAGDSLVGVDPAYLSCDVHELLATLSRADGPIPDDPPAELLQGFHVADAPEFEHWLDGERAYLKSRLVALAGERAHSALGAGNLQSALQAARFASACDPDNESAARRLADLADLASRTTAASRRVVVTPDAGQLPASPIVLEPAPDGPDTAPPHRHRRRRFASVAAGGLGVLALFFLTRGALNLPTPEAPSSLEYKVPVQYRADTALLQRYLRADAILERDDIPVARDSLQQLVIDAPLYAPAWAGLSTALSLSAFEDMPPATALTQGETAARRALALDSTLVEADANLVGADLSGKWDLDGAKRRLDAALRRHPGDPMLLILLGSWHRWRGELLQTVAADSQALAAHPLSRRFALWSAGDLYLAHRCAESAALLRDRYPQLLRDSQVQMQLYRALRCSGRWDEAAMALRESIALSGDTAAASMLGAARTAAERDSATRSIVRHQLSRHLAERRNGWHAAWPVARAYADLHNADSVMVWLDSMYASREMALHKVPFDPLFDFMREDSRFQAFIRRLPWKPALPSGSPPDSIATPD